MVLYRRKELIKRVIEKDPAMIISHPFPKKRTALFKKTCRHQLEGIVAKKTNTPYLIAKGGVNVERVAG